MIEQGIERRGVGMYADDWKVVEEVNSLHRFKNISQSLRFIVSEYQRLKKAYEPPNGKPVNEES